MPRKGLNVPIITALDSSGDINEADQRKIIRYTIQNGKGAESLFVCGTTGEFNRLTNDQRRQLNEIGVDEITNENERLKASPKIEAWLGVTAETKAETLENLKHAISLKADMAVVAPLYIRDLEPADAESFFSEDIAGVLGSEPTIEIGLYENPDISAHNDNGGLLSFEAVRNITKLPFVTCVKASVSRAVLEDYIREFAKDGEMEFPFYFGNAPMIFEMTGIQAAGGRNELPVLVAGVVSGTGNVFPAEWKQAWEQVKTADHQGNAALKKAFEALVDSTAFEGYGTRGSKLIAGLKQAVFRLGVISSADVGNGTPELTADEKDVINKGLDDALDILKLSSDDASLSIVDAAATAPA